MREKRPIEINQQAEIVVLLSGGIDSAALLHFFQSQNIPISAMFIDYNQSAAHHERKASSQVAQRLGIPWSELKLVGGTTKASGEVSARNISLLSLAAMEAPASVWGIALGIHAGTAYPDCSDQFVRAAQIVLSMQSRHVQVLAPFIAWQKRDVIAFFLESRIPLDFTYSCESGTIPVCGSCLSCKDREGLNDRA
ncbi:MAG: 7-cyano-7-deazaguanine synthase [Planctomycetes bacterium]|nr:7-cyano-7-deazaguanine synthase [Planctomycetota bacterium]